MNQSIKFWLGLDIGKFIIACCLYIDDKYINFTIDNSESGFNKLLEILQLNQVNLEQLHICCEATNIYYLSIANYLYANKSAISVVNPAIIKHYANYQLKRVKTDKQDARLIVDYCIKEQPEKWQPENAIKARLKSLCRRAEQLNQIITIEKNRIQVADEHSIESVERIIDCLTNELAECRKQINELIAESTNLTHQCKILESITGVGKTTAQILLSVMVDIDKFPTAKHLISFLGLSPIIRESGKFKGQSKMSKMGDKSIRKALYMPARTACTRSKLWRSWFDKQVARGKHPKQIYVMMMVKLVKFAYACLKKDELFNPELHLQIA